MRDETCKSRQRTPEQTWQGFRLFGFVIFTFLSQEFKQNEMPINPIKKVTTNSEMKVAVRQPTNAPRKKSALREYFDVEGGEVFAVKPYTHRIRNNVNRQQ